MVVEPPPPLYTCSIRRFALSIEPVDAVDALQEYLSWDSTERSSALKFLQAGERLVIARGSQDIIKTRVASLGPKLVERFGKETLDATGDGSVCVFSIDKV